MKMDRTHFLFCIVCLLITSCIRPYYNQQEVDIPSHWRMDGDESSTLCNLRWWEQFKDPVLNDLILRALHNNQDLKVAIYRVVAFYSEYRVVAANMYPFVNGNASYSRQQISFAVPASFPPRTFDNFMLYLSASWELDFWGKLLSATEAAWADMLSQEEARRSVVITVVESLANAYIILRQLDSQLETAKKTYESRLVSLQLAIDRFELGETSELEVKQAESEAEAAAIRKIQFERDIPQQENLISILLGENPHPIERGKPIDDFDYPVEIPAGLPSDLLYRRPDILEAEAQLIAANARVTEARALYFPQITLTGAYGSQSSTLSQLLTGPAEFWSYGVNLVQTIYDTGRNYFLVQEAKAVRNEALANYRQVILRAFREVEDALIGYKKNRELVKENEKQVQYLTEYLNLARLRYEEGEVDYLNVLDADRLLFNSQLNRSQAHSDSFTSVVRLYSALGGGWVDDADAIVMCDGAECYAIEEDEVEVSE